MKICAIICEYNPFHNGHLYQLREAKRLSGADAVLCIMSGNFVQRGEAAVMDKFTRAKHALSAGADAVIELPVVFSTSNAELFAKGAISILSSIPDVNTLCFGCENADKTAFIRAAQRLNDEPKDVSKKIREETSVGVGFAKARANAWAKYIPSELLTSPNNILGVEYTRAILAKNANVDVLPIKRTGSGYNQTKLQDDFPSSTALRHALHAQRTIMSGAPDFVIRDLPTTLENTLEKLEKYAILSRPKKEIARVCDCSEGLENAFKKAAENERPLVETLTSARYTSSRIRRIALQVLLGIEENFIRECLATNLYLRILAVKKDDGELLSSLSRSACPIVARARDERKLEGIAKNSFEKDIFADKIYKLLYPTQKNHSVFY